MTNSYKFSLAIAFSFNWNNTMADQQESLLRQPDLEIARSYHDQLITQLNANGVSVSMDAGMGKGKGIFATEPFSKGDTVWTEKPLVGKQWPIHKSVRFLD